MERIQARALLAAAIFAVFSNSHAMVLPAPQYSAEASAETFLGERCATVDFGPGAQATCGAGFSQGAGGAEGAASAAGGSVAAWSHVNLFTPDANLATFSALASSRTSLNDFLYFTGPAGTRINLIGRLAVDGDLTAAALGGPSSLSSFADVSYSVFGQIDRHRFDQEGRLVSFSDGRKVLQGQGSGTPVLVPLTIDFDAQGESQLISFSVTAITSAGGFVRGGRADSSSQVFIPAQARGESAFGNTVYWDGIVSATDVLGGSFDLSRLQAFSASGFDYMTSAAGHAVPEPGVAPLLLAGLGLLGWRVRRRALIDDLTHSSQLPK